MTQDSARPLLVYCTCPDTDTASRLAHHLVGQQLAACVNILPGIRSVYEWQEKRCEDTEVLLLIKTTTDQLDALQHQILSQHPYELPEIIAVPIEAGLPAYLDWIKSATHKPCD